MFKVDQTMINVIRGNVTAEEFKAFEEAGFDWQAVKYSYLPEKVKQDLPCEYAVAVVQQAKITLRWLKNQMKMMKASDEVGAQVSAAEVEKAIDHITADISRLGDLAKAGMLHIEGADLSRDYADIQSEITFVSARLSIANAATMRMLAEETGLIGPSLVDMMIAAMNDLTLPPGNLN